MMAVGHHIILSSTPREIEHILTPPSNGVAGRIERARSCPPELGGRQEGDSLQYTRLENIWRMAGRYYLGIEPVGPLPGDTFFTKDAQRLTATRSERTNSTHIRRQARIDAGNAATMEGLDRMIG